MVVDRQTDRQTDRKTERQKDRRTDRQSLLKKKHDFYTVFHFKTSHFFHFIFFKLAFLECPAKNASFFDGLPKRLPSNFNNILTNIHTMDIGKT